MLDKITPLSAPLFIKETLIKLPRSKLRGITPKEINSVRPEPVEGYSMSRYNFVASFEATQNGLAERNISCVGSPSGEHVRLMVPTG